MGSHSSIIRRLESAFNARDADTLATLVTPDFEMVTPRGTLTGTDGMREFVRRQTFGAGLHVHAERFFERGETVVVEGRSELRFAETGEVAETMRDAVIYTMRDGRVARLVPQPDLQTALSEAGLGPDDERKD